MSVGKILTLGFGTFGGVEFLPTLGYGTEGVPATVTTPDRGAGRSRTRRRYRSITVKLNGEYVECQSVEQLLELLKDLKKEVPANARARVAEIVRSGRKVADVKREDVESIELVSAPEYAKDVIEKRIEEIQLAYWKAIEKAWNAINNEEDELIILMLNG